jgi:hypothetical protein
LKPIESGFCRLGSAMVVAGMFSTCLHEQKIRTIKLKTIIEVRMNLFGGEIHALEDENCYMIIFKSYLIGIFLSLELTIYNKSESIFQIQPQQKIYSYPLVCIVVFESQYFVLNKYKYEDYDTLHQKVNKT